MADMGADFPQVSLKNGAVEMTIFLPDLEHGSYRSTRFDHAGLIHSLRYKGMEYFGPWLKNKHDPYSHEAVNGPADSYGVLGYGDTDSFVRVGVGILAKPVGERQFSWNRTYEIEDFGRWEWKECGDAIHFEQRVEGPDGWAFVYRKTVQLTQEGFRLQYELCNNGERDINTEVYNHNFLAFGKFPVDSQYSVEVPYALRAAKLDPRVSLDGGRLSLHSAIGDEDETRLFMQMDGSKQIIDHRIAIRHASSCRSLEISMDRPLKRLVVWANDQAIAPENFVDVHVPAGETRHWSAEYKVS